MIMKPSQRTITKTYEAKEAIQDLGHMTANYIAISMLSRYQYKSPAFSGKCWL